jgi:microcystin-dependent protein
MSQPYLGQIEAFAFGYAPKGWATCSGQILSIQQNSALFALLGTTYGGNGVQTFALPDLRSRIAMGQGTGPGLTPRVMGEVSGEENHTLLVTETPNHNHSLRVAALPAPATNTQVPGPTVVLAQGLVKPTGGAQTTPLPFYVADTAPNQPMAPSAIGNTGGQPHPNLMPYLAINFCISLSGIFPSRN